MSSKTILSDENLKCSLCNSVYRNPVVSECGETGCKECMQKTVTQENIDQYKCPFCSQYHVIPIHGFVPNKFVENILEKRQPIETELNMNEAIFNKQMNIQQLLFNLKQIRIEIDKINSIIQNPNEDLNEYCSILKQQIQVSTEKKIHLMNKFNNELLERVNEYQAENKEGFKSNPVDFKNIEEFYDQWSNVSELSNVNENEIIDAMNKSNNFKSYLQSYLPFLRLNNLNDSEFIMQFNETPESYLNSDLIGYVGYNRRAIRNFESLEEIDMSAYLKNKDDYFIQIQPLENGNYIVAYPAEKDGHLMTALLMVNNDFKKQHKVYINHDLNNIKMYSFKESFIITIKEEIKRILFYDLNLYFIKETKLTPYPMEAFMFLDESNIYMYSVEDPTKTFYYNCDYNYRKNIPKLLLFSNSLIHIPFEKASQVESFESKLYFRYENKISIIDQNDGSLVNTFSGISDKCDFVIDRKYGCLITFDAGMKKLVYFTSKGIKFYESEIKNLPNDDFSISYSKLHGLLIYLSKKAKIFI